MTEYLLRLRSGAAVRRQVLDCEPDPLVLSGDHDDVGHWFADGEVAATIFARASLHGNAFALVATPNGDFVWLPSEALTQSESDDTAELVESLPACGTRTAVQWQAATVPSDTDWVQVEAEGDRVLFRRWDKTRQVGCGATYFASACDVLAKTPIEAADRNRCGSVLVANERRLQALSDDAAVVAQLLVRFMHRAFGDAWPGQLHLAADTLGLFARILTDVEVSEVDPVLQNEVQQATKPRATDHCTAADVSISATAPARAVEPERRSHDIAVPVLDVPGTNTECSSGKRDQPIPDQHRRERPIASAATDVRGDRRARAITSDQEQEASENCLPSAEAPLATDERRPELGNVTQSLQLSAGELHLTAGADPDASLIAASPGVEVELQDKPPHRSAQRQLASVAAGDFAKPDRVHQPHQTTRNSHRGGTGPVPTSDPQLPSHVQFRAGTLERPGAIRTANDAVLALTTESDANGAWKATLPSSPHDCLDAKVPTAKASSSESRVTWESHQLVVADQALNPQSVDSRPAKNRHAETPLTEEVLLEEQSGDTDGIGGGEHTVTWSRAPVNEASSRVVREPAVLTPTRYDGVELPPHAHDLRTGIARLDASRLDTPRVDTPRRIDSLRVDSAKVELPRVDSSRTELPRAEPAGPAGEEVITQARPVLKVLSLRPFPEVKALNAFAQIAPSDARQLLNSQGADKTTDIVQPRLDADRNAGASSFFPTQQVSRTRQQSADDRLRSYLAFGGSSSVRSDSSTGGPGTLERVIGAPRASKGTSAGIQYRPGRQSLDPSVRTRTAAVGTRLHAGAPQSDFAVERSIEIGEIVVEIGNLELPTSHNARTSAGSLIAAIPQSRLGARR